MTPATADLCDEHGDRVRVAAPIFRDYGGNTAFGGEIATVKVREDNALVRAALEEAGRGRVLVIDGAGSLRCALVGDRLAGLAQINGWSGIIIYGCVRDTDGIARVPIGVKAINAHPAKSAKTGAGELGINVSFAGITFVPGHFVYADRDGIVVTQASLA